MDQTICTTDEYRVTVYRLNGELHRLDGPAIIKPDGTEEWCQHGNRHRVDGPAYLKPDGTEEFWLNGQKVDIMVHFLQRP